MEKKHLYIVLTRTNTVLSRLIHFIKNDEYTHAAISLDKNLCQMYSFGRKYVYNPFLGRFRHEGLNEGVYKLCKTVPGIIMELEISQEQYERIEDLLEQFILNSNYYKYNYKGLIFGLINKPMQEDDTFLCSEFVYHLLKESEIADLNISRNLVRPQSLLDIKSKVVYKGDLKKIKQHVKVRKVKEIEIEPLYKYAKI